MKILFLILTILTLSNAKIGLYEKLGQKAFLDAKFYDQNGRYKSLKEFANNKPLVISLNYYKCTTLCSIQISAMAKVLNYLKLKEGIDYIPVTISFNPDDTVKLAKGKSVNYTNLMRNDFDKNSWLFLTAKEQDIKNFVNSVGFGFEKVINKDGSVDFIHPAALIIISPSGTISRYLKGTKYSPFDLKLAVFEALEEKTGVSIAKTALLCFAYDPKSKTYVFAYKKVFAILTLLILIGLFIYLIKSKKGK